MQMRAARLAHQLAKYCSWANRFTAAGGVHATMQLLSPSSVTANYKAVEQPGMPSVQLAALRLLLRLGEQSATAMAVMVTEQQLVSELMQHLHEAGAASAVISVSKGKTAAEKTSADVKVVSPCMPRHMQHLQACSLVARVLATLLKALHNQFVDISYTTPTSYGQQELSTYQGAKVAAAAVTYNFPHVAHATHLPHGAGYSRYCCTAASSSRLVELSLLQEQCNFRTARSGRWLDISAAVVT